ncbi:hypothetical protein ACVMH6_003451 [Rhizobium leguminosarum]
MPPLVPVSSIPGAGAAQPDEDITGKGNGSHQDCHHPKLERIDCLPRINRFVGKDREDDDGHRQQDQSGPEFKPGQSAKKSMQRLPRCKKGRYCHSACGRYRHIRHDRAKAERKDRQGGDGAGGAVILFLCRLHAAEEENRDAKEYKDSCRQNRACHRLQETAEAAEET